MPVIKIHYFSDDLPRLQKTSKGDWIDLYCAQTMTLHAGEFVLVPLGVSMQLPEGYEARTAPRSSTFKRWGILHRICQFRIYEVQPPIDFEECDALSDTDRGGFGSTGVR